MKRRWAAVWVLAVLLVSSSGWAQVSTSQISGAVTDKSGAVVPGAKVTATNDATGVSFTTTTTEGGAYSFPSLTVGPYTITIEAPGFSKFVSSKNVLNVGSPLVVNAVLEIGELTSIVQVEGSYERLNTSNATISDVISRREIRDLPLNGRNPLNLIPLQPGAIQRSSGGAGSGTHINGSRDRAFNLTLDGIDINEPSVPNPQNNVFRLTTDNVQEYRIVTTNATAEFGRNSGANIAIATRAGTNEIHGNLYEYWRNPILNAKDFFVNALGGEKPNFKVHQFGADVGGPVIKNRTHWFFSWQGQRVGLTQPIAEITSIPLTYTATARQGIFRFVRGNVMGFTRNSPGLVDAQGNLLPGIPTCGAAVTTNCVDTYNIAANDPANIGLDPIMGAYIGATPLPNDYSTGDGLNFAGFNWNPPSRQPEQRFLGRVDHQFNENNSIFVRYTWAYADTKDGDFLNSRPQLFPGFPPLGEVIRRPKNLAASYRRVFSPQLVNEFTAGFSRFIFDFAFGRANPDFPNIPPFDITNAADPFNNQSGTARFLTTIQFIDNISYTRGSHMIRAGLNFRFLQHNDQRSFVGGVNNAPRIQFSGAARDPSGAGFVLPSGMNSNDNTALRNAINELLGRPSQMAQAFFASGLDAFTPSGLYVRGARLKQYNFYVQDEWRVRRNLTINAGLRYELNLPPTESNDLILRPDKSLSTQADGGLVSFVSRKKFWDRNNANALAPRIGIAWDPTGGGNMVIRAGYAIAYDPISTFQMVPVLGLVPGSSAACTLTITDTAAPTSTANCPIPANATARIGQGFPLGLPQPSVPPSFFAMPPITNSSNAVVAGSVDPNLKNPTVHDWSLTIQRDMGHDIVAQVGYVGKRGMRLLRAYDPNQRKLSSEFLASFIRARDNLLVCGDARGTATCGQPVGLLQSILGNSVQTNSTVRTNLQRNAAGSLAAFIDGNSTFFNNMVNVTGQPDFFRTHPQFGDLFYMDNSADSIYHALQIHVRRQGRNLTFGAAYTFSKSIDNGSVDPVAATSGGAVGNNSRSPTDVFNFAIDRGRSDFDRTHSLVMHAVYDLPFGRTQRWGGSQPMWLQHFIGGWTLTGILTRTTGEPWSVLSGRNTNSNRRFSRANIVGPKPSTGIFDVSGVVGPTVFDANTLAGVPQGNALTGTIFAIPEPGLNGNQGRNIFDGPSYFNLDLGITKGFDITERWKLQFRAEMFNAFNHPNFDNPLNSTDGSTSITSSSFARTCCASVSTPSSTSLVSIGEAARIIQLALRLSF